MPDDFPLHPSRVWIDHKPHVTKKWGEIICPICGCTACDSWSFNYIFDRGDHLTTNHHEWHICYHCGNSKNNPTKKSTFFDDNNNIASIRESVQAELRDL